MGFEHRALGFKLPNCISCIGGIHICQFMSWSIAVLSHPTLKLSPKDKKYKFRPLLAGTQFVALESFEQQRRNSSIDHRRRLLCVVVRHINLVMDAAKSDASS